MLSRRFDRNAANPVSPIPPLVVAFCFPNSNTNTNTNIRSERRKEELYAFSEEELRPYFALPEVQIIPYILL